MDCYNFCQQCENYFATAGTAGTYKISCAISFLRNRINFCWQEYKQKLDAYSTIPVKWDKFKVFFRRSVGDFRAIIDTYWGKIKKNFHY